MQDQPKPTFFEGEIVFLKLKVLFKHQFYDSALKKILTFAGNMRNPATYPTKLDKQVKKLLTLKTTMSREVAQSSLILNKHKAVTSACLQRAIDTHYLWV